MKLEPEELQSNAEGSISRDPFVGGKDSSTIKPYLSGPSVYERLEDDEQIHYLLVNEWFGLVAKTNSGSSGPNYAPTGDFRSIAAVTDKRILFVIGQEGGDKVISIDIDDVEDAIIQRGALSTKIQFETVDKNYIFRVRETDSSDPDEVVEYIQRKSSEAASTHSAEQTSSHSDSDGHDDDDAGKETSASQFISDQNQVSQDALSRLKVAAQKFSTVDPQDGEFNESIYALEDAKEELGSLIEEPGVGSETIESTSKQIDIWLKPLRQVRTALTDGIRKRLLVERSGNVAADALEDTFESLVEANSIAEAFGWPTDELQKVLTQLKDEVDDSALIGTYESDFNWQGTVSADAEEMNVKSNSTQKDSSDWSVSEVDSIDEITTELESELSSLSDITDEIASQIKTELDRFDTKVNGSSNTSGKPSRKDVIEEIEHISAKLEKRPSKGEFDRHKSIDGDYVYDHFESWDEAIAAADIKKLSKSDLLDELQRLQEELGFPPISTHINEEGKFSTHDYQREFGSVDDALEIADIDCESFISQRLEEAVSNTDGKLTMSEFADSIPYSESVIYKFYHSWEDAVNSVTSSPIEEPDSKIQQNELTEWYELVRNLKNVCDIVVDVASESNDAETTDPAIQWYNDIKTFYNGGSNIETGYGAQQAEKNPFSVKDYRSKFGNGERTTEFEYVSAKPISTSVKRLLRSHTELELDEIYLPVGPETEDKFPVIVESEGELQRAKNMLGNLPDAPDPADNNTTEPNTGGSPDEPTTEETELKSVPGVTATIATALQEAGYRTRKDLQEASTEELEKVENVTHQDVLRIKVSVGG